MRKATDLWEQQVPKGERRTEASEPSSGPSLAIRRWTLAAALVTLSCARATAYELKAHPRIFVAPNGAQILATRAGGSLRSTYEEIKVAANRALAAGIQKPRSGSDTPVELVSLGICYMVERAAGRDAKAYADAVKAFWGDGAILSREGNGPFGYYAIAYDWCQD